MRHTVNDDSVFFHGLVFANCVIFGEKFDTAQRAAVDCESRVWV